MTDRVKNLTRDEATTCMCVSQYLFECDPHGRPHPARGTPFWHQYETKRDLLGSVEVRDRLITFGVLLERGYGLAMQERLDPRNANTWDFDVVPHLCERLIGLHGIWEPSPEDVRDIILNYCNEE